MEIGVVMAMRMVRALQAAESKARYIKYCKSKRKLDFVHLTNFKLLNKIKENSVSNCEFLKL